MGGPQPVALEESRPGLRRLLIEHPRILIGVSLLLALALISLLAPLLAPHNPLAVDPDNARLPPGPGHLLGTADRRLGIAPQPLRLRLRGASPAQLRHLAGWVAACVAVAGSTLALGFAYLAVAASRCRRSSCTAA